MTPSLLETTKRKNEDTPATPGTNKRAKILKHASTIADTTGADMATQATSGTKPCMLSNALAVSATVTQSHSSQSSRGVFSMPLKTSSSNIDPGCIPLSDSTSHRSGCAPGATNTHSEQASKSNESSKTKPKDIEHLLKNELKGAVGLHSMFFSEFFVPIAKQQPAVDVQAEVVKQVCAQNYQGLALGPSNYIDYNNSSNKWTIHTAIKDQRDEKLVYSPLAKALNVVGQAAFNVYRTMFPLDTICQEYFPFTNHSAYPARYDSPSDGDAKPDLIQGSLRDNRVHWADVELIIECKSSSKTSDRNLAYLQLARYARVVFAHQIYRLRVFGFSLCGSIVNFVCFDRSGMLHSPDIDLSKPGGSHSFVQHIISLLTLEPRLFGYDDRYEFNYNVTPTQILFRFNNGPPEPVTDILCHRKCICGRATCVTCLGENVHKSIWRPENRPDEGETMANFINVFGFCQLRDHSTGKYSTKLRYKDHVKCSDATIFFSPSSRRTGDSAKKVSIERGIRIQSNIIMRRGTSLLKAQNPLHLVMAIHDALLGIMALTEVGKLHCDISAYNLLLVNPEKHYIDQNWLEPSKFPAKPDVWNRNARGTFKQSDNVRSDTGQGQCEYESPRLKRVKELGRGPYCVLHDTEFIINEERDSKDIHIDRTGTPAFISLQLLLDEPVARTFMHDIESLFWVMFWVLICRSQDENNWTVNKHAEDQIRALSSSSMPDLCNFKTKLISSIMIVVGETFGENIKKLDNPWCEDLSPLLIEFGDMIYYYLYHKASDTPLVNTSPDEDSDEDLIDAPKVDHKSWMLQRHNWYIDQPHLKTFEALFKMLNRHIRILKKKYTVDLTQL